SLDRPARRWIGLSLGLLFGSAVAAAPSVHERPRLVVLLVIDRFDGTALPRVDRRLGPRGLGRLLARGSVYRARFRHAVSLAAPNLAVLITGAYPHLSGVVSDSVLREGATDGLLAPTVGDLLRDQSPTSKVLALADTLSAAAILAGKRGRAFGSTH